MDIMGALYPKYSIIRIKTYKRAKVDNKYNRIR